MLVHQPGMPSVHQIWLGFSPKLDRALGEFLLSALNHCGFDLGMIKCMLNLQM